MRIGIIGGGVMGLALGRRLALAGHETVVLESAPQVGGLATWHDYGPFTWDQYYHVICRQDADLLGLIRELGLEREMRWTETKTGFLWNGRLLSMSGRMEFLRFPALSLVDKVRLAAGIVRCQRIGDPAPLERAKASDWLRGVFGNRVYETIWEPLLKSKFGVLKDQIPATIMWATIKRYYEARGGGGGPERMGFLRGGLKTLFTALVRDIEDRGGRIRCSSPVISAHENGAGCVVETTEDRYEFDRVVGTVPSALLRKMAPGAEGLFAEAPDGQPVFLGVVCMALVLKRRLSPFYITNLIQSGFPFTGIIEVSNLTGPEELEGHHLVMLPRYETPDSEWFAKTSGEIAETFLSSLEGVWPGLREHLVRYEVHRAKRVQAIWLETPPPADFRPGSTPSGLIWNVNAELAGRDTLNNNAIVRTANRAAELFLASAAGAPAPAAAGRA